MEKNLLITPLSIFCLVLAPMAPAAVVTLQEGTAGYTGAEDSYITNLTDHTNRNFGKSVQIGAGASVNRGRVKTLIRFDLSKLGAFTTVTAAKLKLTLAHAEATSSPLVVNLYPLTAVNQDWSAGSGKSFYSSPENGTACWNHRQYQNFFIPPQGQDCASMGNPERCPGPAGIDWGKTTFGMVGTPGLAAGVDYDAIPLATATVPADAEAGSTVELVFTGGLDILKDWATTPANNAGFLLDVPAGNGAVWVHSSESYSPALRPVLELTGDFELNLMGLAYNLPSAGYVSILIQDQNNNTIKELAAAKQVPAGHNVEFWDGADNKGVKVPDGAYQWKLVNRGEIKAEYLMSLGISTKFEYPGNHNPVTGFAIDSGHLFAGSGSSEGPPSAVKMAQDGSKLLASLSSSAAGVFGGFRTMAADGGYVYMLKAADVAATSNTLYRYTSSLTGSATWTIGSQVLDLKARSGKLAILTGAGINWLSTTSGAVTGSLPGAFRGIAIDNAGTAYAISGTKIVKFTGTTPTDLVTSGLVSPSRMDICPDGDILVVDGDKHAAVPGPMQVKRFGADGAFKAAYGRAGGRAHIGPYVKSSFLFTRDYTQLYCAPDNSFWVSELHVPARIAHFSDNGQWLAEFTGGQSYANYGTPDPEDPTIAYIQGTAFQNSILEVKINYAAKSYEIVNIWNPTIRNWNYGLGTTSYRILRYGAKKFICDLGEGLMKCGELDRTTWNIKPSFIWGRRASWELSNLLPASLTAPAGTVQGMTYTWADLNGDGLPTRDEMRYGNCHINGFAAMNQTGVDADFSLYFPWSARAACYDSLNMAFVKVTPVGNTAGGLPIWPQFNWHERATFRQLGQMPADVFQGLLPVGNQDCGYYSGQMNTGIEVDGGRVWIPIHTKLGEVGGGFWGSRITGLRVLVYDTAGNFISSTGRHVQGAGVPNGFMQYSWSMAGAAFGTAFIIDSDGMTHMWDSAGLFIARFPDITTCRGQHCVFGENFSGSSVPITTANTVPGLDSGDVLYFNGSSNSTSIFRITGLAAMYRLYGTVTVAGSKISSEIINPLSAGAPGKTGIQNRYPGRLLVREVMAGLIQFRYPEALPAHSRLDIHTITGEKFASLVNQAKFGGVWSWDARQHPTGVYFARLASGGRLLPLPFVIRH